MNSDEIKNCILKILREIGHLNVEPNPETLYFKNLQLDSLSIIEFCMKLEEKIGISIEPVDILQHENIDEIAKAIEARLSK